MSADPDKLEITRLDALVTLRGDEDALRLLLEKAIARRDAEMAVYAKVIADYQARIAGIAAQVQAERPRAHAVLQTLAAVHERRRQALEAAQAKLQECEFRHSIGEYSDAQLATASQAAQASIAECETAFESVRVLRERYLELFADVAQPAAPPVAASPVAAAPVPPTPPVPQKPAVAAAPVPPVPPVVPAPVRGPAAAPVESDATVYMAQPSPEDFLVPGKDDPNDTGGFGTVLISAALLIEQRCGLPITHYRLGMLTTIGRTADNHIVVPLKDVSRRHAEVRMVPNGYLLKDLESPNGTFVNGARITEHLLKDGDLVTVGETVFAFKKP